MWLNLTSAQLLWLASSVLWIPLHVHFLLLFHRNFLNLNVKDCLFNAKCKTCIWELWNALAFLHKTKNSALRSHICFSTLPWLSHLTAVVAYVTSPPNSATNCQWFSTLALMKLTIWVKISTTWLIFSNISWCCVSQCSPKYVGAKYHLSSSLSKHGVTSITPCTTVIVPFIQCSAASSI